MADGSRGLVEVAACGLQHLIEVSLNRIAQKPVIDHTTEPVTVKTGTSVKIHWPEIASSQPFEYSADFYQPGLLSNTFDAALVDLIADFAAFNPQATFRFGDLSFLCIRSPLAKVARFGADLAALVSRLGPAGADRGLHRQRKRRSAANGARLRRRVRWVGRHQVPQASAR